MSQSSGGGATMAMVLLALLMLMSAPTAVRAAAADDCPLAHQPYSSRTVLLDLLINTQTRVVLDRDAPGITKRTPAIALKTKTPTFAAIVSPAFLAGQWPSLGIDLRRLDRDLSQVPVTPLAATQRCARYDHEPPVIKVPARHPAILVFDKITGFRDDPSVAAATAALKGMAERNRWSIVFTDNGAAFTGRTLKGFDAVVWNNVSGDALTVPQEAALKHYVERGGGFAAFHGSGGDPVYVWDWYADTLIGARFLGHPSQPQFQAARVLIDDPADPIVKGLGDWTMTEEWYSFGASPRLTGAHVLARLDEASYSPRSGTTDLRMGDHPIAWTRCVGRGRSFYTAIGHRPESYSEPHSVTLLERGIAWSIGEYGNPCGRPKIHR